MIVLPLPPSVNSLYGQRPRSQRYKTAAYKDWLKDLPDIEPKQYERIALRYTFYFPDKRVRDIENYCKAVTDYLVAQGFIVDDSWKHLYRLTLVFGGIDKETARVEIGIESTE